MCTLTYLPVKDGYIFTHNRDERMDRPTSKEFQKKEVAGQTLYYPEDLEAHGSWIAFSDRGTTACLLNGGSEPYDRKASYRKSRGLVVLESFGYSSIRKFYDSYDFENIEPFTLLIRSANEFGKIIHDENQTRLSSEDPTSQNIWSSTTLYTKEVRNKRQKWFKDWLAKDPPLTPESVRLFHTRGGEGDIENDLVMSRWGLLKTLSVTQINLHGQAATLLYSDFTHHSTHQLSIHLR